MDASETSRRAGRHISLAEGTKVSFELVANRDKKSAEILRISDAGARFEFEYRRAWERFSLAFYGDWAAPGAEFAPYYFISGYLFSRDILNIYQALRHPVWMVRGTRGDFVDHHHVPRVKNRSNWTFDVLDTGAFPQFEALSLLAVSYDTFIGKSVGVSYSTHMPEVLNY
jgi:hypothetical protein